jgi:O-antigen ligase
LTPFLAGFIFIQIFSIKDFKKIGYTFTAFAFVNILISLFQLCFFSGSVDIAFLAGFFTDRNHLARFINIVNCFILLEFLSANKRRIKVFLFGFLVLSFICITFLLSRGGYLSYFITTVFILWNIKNKTMKIFFPFFITFLVFLFTIMILVRIQNDKMNVKNASDLGRIALNKAGLNMIFHNPIIGVGYQMSGDRFNEYQDKHLFGLSYVTTIHNSFIAIFAETGIFGFTLYFLFNVGLCFELIKIARKKKYILHKKGELFCISSLVIFLVYGLTYPLPDYEGIYWLIIALSIITLRDSVQELTQQY